MWCFRGIWKMDINLQFEEVYNEFINDKIAKIKIVDRCFEAYDDKRYYAFISGLKEKKL